MIDKTVFAKDRSEIESLKAQLAERAAAPKALPAATPAAPAASLPPPGYVRLDVPKEAMNDEFWARLAGAE